MQAKNYNIKEVFVMEKERLVELSDSVDRRQGKPDADDARSEADGSDINDADYQGQLPTA